MVDAGFEGGAFVRRQTRNDMSGSGKQSAFPKWHRFREPDFRGTVRDCRTKKRARLIGTGLFNRIDNEQLNRTLFRLQAQAKFLNCSEYRRSCWIRGSCGRASCRGLTDLRAPFEIDVVSRSEAGAVGKGGRRGPCLWACPERH